MTWNYRVIKTELNYEEEYSIHEVYYDEDGNPDGVTENSIAPTGGTLEELQADLDHYNEAMSLPVLDFDLFLKQEED